MPDHVHRLGLGLAAVARPAYITSGRDALGASRSVDELRARTTALLDAAYAAGVRYLDVARSYGRAEEFLAGWLVSRPGVDDVVVGSKWGYRYVGDWRLDADVHETKDHSLDAYTEQVAQSRVLLGPVEIGQLESNLAGAVVEPPEGLDDLREPARRYWTTRSARPWA